MLDYRAARALSHQDDGALRAGGHRTTRQGHEIFDALQDELLACVKEAHGLDLGRLRLASPFDSRLKYNLYSCLRLILAHQRQHLVPAENVVDSLRSIGDGG